MQWGKFDYNFSVHLGYDFHHNVLCCDVLADRFVYITYVFYEKRVYKKHEAQIGQKFRNIKETQVGWVSKVNLKNLFLRENVL